MASRRGVGASIAAAIIFSSLMISNFVLLSGEQQRFRLVSVAAEERTLTDRASIMRGGAIILLLDSAERVLSSRTFDCGSALDEAGSAVAGITATLRQPYVSVEAALRRGPAEDFRDPTPGVQPFNGTLTGLLAFVSEVSLDGSSPDYTVTMKLNETHVVNLPVRVESLNSTCLQSFAAVLASLEALGESICNASVVGPRMSALGAELSATAESAGFSSSLSYSIMGSSGCVVGFTVTMWQDDVPGPEGPFRFTVSESGLL